MDVVVVEDIERGQQRTGPILFQIETTSALNIIFKNPYSMLEVAETSKHESKLTIHRYERHKR